MSLFFPLHSHLPSLFSWLAPLYFSHLHSHLKHHTLYASVFCTFLLSLSCTFFWCWPFFVLRADIDECERLPQPCVHQCINTPGSFKCTCPPGQHLLGDGKSCAGLERLLPSYESYSYGYRTSQSIPNRSSSYQQLYHNMASQSYHSYAAATRGRNRGRRKRSLLPSQQGSLSCQLGFVFRGGHCVGNYNR